MKIHFGHGVVLFAGLFVAFIFYLVSQMLGERVDLVERDYYEQGLEYQEVINQKMNERISFDVSQKGADFMIQTKSELTTSSCLLELYRPSDSYLDTSVLVPLVDGTALASNLNMQQGMYRYTLRYKEGETWYHQEGELIWR